MTNRQEQLADLLHLRLYPLRRLLLDRVDMERYTHVSKLDGEQFFDEELYAEAAGAAIRLEAIIQAVKARLPVSPLVAWLESPEDTPVPSTF